MSSNKENTATKTEARPSLVPKVRFPEFRGAEQWKGVPLSELVSALDAGVSVNSGDRPATENEIGILKTSAVSNGIFEPQENKVVFDEVEKGRVKERVQEDTIIISRMNTPALVGANAYVETGLKNIYLPDRLWAAKSKPGTSMRFVAAILGSDKGRAALSRLAKGSSGSMKNITKPDVLAFLIEAPSSAEQQKIADCMSSVDELVAAQARKVHALKIHKKGLMQKLFPREGESQPRLRFPEFQNAGEWEEQSIGDFGKVVTGSTPSTVQPRFYGGGIPFVSPADISDRRFVDQTKITLTADGLAEARLIRAGSILFVCIGSTIGKAAQSIRDCATNQQINAVVPSSMHSDGFVYFALSFASERIALLAGKQAVPIINKSIFSSVRLRVPKLNEQQRIASCLSSLDALIAAEAQKLEALNSHKKGLMQLLFPSPERSQT